MTASYAFCGHGAGTIATWRSTVTALKCQNCVVTPGAELLYGAVPMAPVRPDAISAWTATMSSVDKKYSSTCNSGSPALR